jgi:hypothetical protein
LESQEFLEGEKSTFVFTLDGVRSEVDFVTSEITQPTMKLKCHRRLL